MQYIVVTQYSDRVPKRRRPRFAQADMATQRAERVERQLAELERQLAAAKGESEQSRLQVEDLPSVGESTPPLLNPPPPLLNPPPPLTQVEDLTLLVLAAGHHLQNYEHTFGGLLRQGRTPR